MAGDSGSSAAAAELSPGPEVVGHQDTGQQEPFPATAGWIRIDSLLNGLHDDASFGVVPQNGAMPALYDNGIGGDLQGCGGAPQCLDGRAQEYLNGQRTAHEHGFGQRTQAPASFGMTVTVGGHIT